MWGLFLFWCFLVRLRLAWCRPCCGNGNHLAKRTAGSWRAQPCATFGWIYKLKPNIYICGGCFVSWRETRAIDWEVQEFADLLLFQEEENKKPVPDVKCSGCDNVVGTEKTDYPKCLCGAPTCDSCSAGVIESLGLDKPPEGRFCSKVCVNAYKWWEFCNKFHCLLAM